MIRVHIRNMYGGYTPIDFAQAEMMRIEESGELALFGRSNDPAIGFVSDWAYAEVVAPPTEAN